MTPLRRCAGGVDRAAAACMPTGLPHCASLNTASISCGRLCFPAGACASGALPAPKRGSRRAAGAGAGGMGCRSLELPLSVRLPLLLLMCLPGGFSPLSLPHTRHLTKPDPSQMHDQQWQPHPDGAAAGAPAALPELPLEAVEGGYLAVLHACLLGELRLEPLVVGLSDGYELCRCELAGAGGERVGGLGSAGQLCRDFLALAGRWVLHLGAVKCVQRRPWDRRVAPGRSCMLQPHTCPPPLNRLIESDAAALAGRPAKWVPPDKFQRVTRSECRDQLAGTGAGLGRCLWVGCAICAMHSDWKCISCRPRAGQVSALCIVLAHPPGLHWPPAPLPPCRVLAAPRRRAAVQGGGDEAPAHTYLRRPHQADRE